MVDQRLTNMLSSLLRLPEDQIFNSLTDDLSQYYINWGFTIYRTFYNAASDEHWNALISKIHAQVRDEVILLAGSDANNPTAQHFLSLFRLDIRDDAEVLNNLDMDATRHAYMDAVGGPPMHHDFPQLRYFFLADEQVLTSMNEGRPFVKFVQADYKDADYVPRNTRLGGQSYFGWMMMTTGGVVELWSMLRIWDLERIAPRAIGGVHSEVWDGM